MAALGSLVVQLGLNYAQFTGGADAAEQRALQMSKRVQDTMDGLKSGIATTVGAIAGGLAAGFTISAFKGLISGAVETGAALDDLAMQTGASVEALSGLAAVGKYSNQSAESIGGAMNKLAKNMAGATEESKGAGAAVRALGIDFDTFKKQSPDEQLRTIAKAMDGFENSSGKAAVAQALLGKEGAKMLPFFNDLATVGELQAKVTTEQAAAAANFDDNLDRLTSSGDAWKKQLALAMIPALDQGLQAFLDVSNGTGGLRAEIKRLSEDGSIKQFTTTAVTGLTYVADAAQLGWRGIKVMAEGIGAYAAAGVAYFGAVGSAIGKAMKGDFTGALADMRTGMSEAGTIVSDLGESVITTFSEDTMGSRIRARMKDLDALGGGGREVKKNLDFTNVLDKDKNAAAAAADAMAALIEQIKGRDKLQLAQAKETTEELKSLRKRGSLGEIEAIEQVADAEIKALATSRALMTEELAIYGTKQNSQKDVAATKARIAEQDEKIGAREKQLNRELLESYAQYNAEADKRLDGRYKDTAALDKQLEQLEFEAKTIGATAEQVRLLEAARTEEMAVALERQAVTRRLIDGNSAEADQLERQAELLRKIAGQKGANGIAAEAASQWKAFTESLYNGLTDSLFRGFEAGKGFFRSFWDGIKNTFKTSVLKLLVQGVMTGITGLAGSAASAAGLVGNQAGGAGGVLGGANLASSAFSLISGAGSALASGVSSGLTGFFAGEGGAIIANGISSAVGASTVGGASFSIGSVIGAAAPYALAAVVALNALGVFRSEKKTDVGFKGTLGAESDVSGFTTIRKGGTLFSGPSYRDELSALPAATKLAIDQSVGSMFTSVKGFSDVLGLNSKAIDGFTKDIFISTQGLTDAQIQEKLAATFKSLGDDLANLVAGGILSGAKAGSAAAAAAIQEDAAGALPVAYAGAADPAAGGQTVSAASALDPFRRAGESAIDTLGRLANSLSGANAIFDSLGQTALKASLAGGAAASALVDLFGGIDKFSAAAGSFLQDF
ncbi:hypothetical protein [Xylophilus sp. Leaf220]|uniref:hypothetical protein n=1 Tax=Xylophilus sp. Leaf220 TaxID=1735686 RepID=UPI0006FF597E|nr:hypothetical protein [Xylophilus sp. Leaf220]KQM78916.1 hypothetical protein ASE76_16125 [Xylophilus sp. Leaf220]